MRVLLVVDRSTVRLRGPAGGVWRAGRCESEGAMSDVDPRYPIGKFLPPDTIDTELRTAHVAAIAAAPGELRAAVSGLSPRQLDTPYRDGGWTVRQVVHHLADSHLNAYVRFKLALTEEEPTIKPYAEGLWAELPEARVADVALSFDLLAALHARWVMAIRVLPAPAFARTFRHPERGVMSIDRLLALYAWHGRHHVAHITSLRERMGWR
jgi:uncharacterized damage-inducible protein DinB